MHVTVIDVPAVMVRDTGGEARPRRKNNPLRIGATVPMVHMIKLTDCPHWLKETAPARSELEPHTQGVPGERQVRHNLDMCDGRTIPTYIMV
jgi:hypothetical protein